ncbi:hypothetical protein KI688_000054 [Linnemannia hyalina]|uniref:C2H2-type domain-containing protein n=1 Tax=Linnemannia hyalina TaxID=64524 RepID=A0A9P7Y3I3_9FUNG|nr:hypothetical protein KI688_000054 [Linnemannia hyalina]
MAEERPTTAEPHHESELDEHTLLLHLQQTIANNNAALQQQQDNNNHNTDAPVPISTTTVETAASTEDNVSATHNQPAATAAASLETIPVTSQEAAVAAVAAFANSFNDTTADDIKALTKALTTPIEQIEAEERAAAAAVAAVAASVAASAAGVDHSVIAKTDIATPAFDVNNVYNQVLSSIASQTQTTTTEGKRTAQEAFEQTQAAQALQLIALSLGSVTANTTTTTVESAVTTGHADSTVAHHTGDGAGAVPGTTDPLLSITEAISNFQRQTEQHPKLDEDTTAIAQAVLLATQANANKEALQGTSQAGPSSSSAESGANQGLTFEVDKATGKTQIKWVPDSRDDASVIQQALHTLIANSGILGVANGGLLAPPLGQFPAQGSQFGTAKEPVKTEPAAMAPPPVPHVHKKRRTGGSSTQNTAASIPEGATAYPCTFDGCDKVFARLYNLKSHSRTHTNERPFDLKRHVKIHGGDKPFKCGGCGKSFSRLDALGRHKYNSKNRANCVDSITPVLE